MATIQNFLPYDTVVGNNYKTYGQTINSAISTLGWVKDTDASGYQVNWSTITPVSLPTNCYVYPRMCPSSVNPRGAWSSANAYNGSNAGFSADMVTYSGATYICYQSTQKTISNVSANGSTATINVTGTHYFIPGTTVVIAGLTHTALNGTWTIVSCPSTTQFTFSVATTITSVGDTGTATITSPPTSDLAQWSQPAVSQYGHWLPYNYEVWVSNGALSSTCPIYLKLVYGYAGYSTSSSYLPMPYFNCAVGTGSDHSGNIVGNFFDPGVQGYSEYYLSFPTSFTSSPNTTPWECDFSGDADNLRMILWRNSAGTFNNAPQVLVIDRGRDSSGNAIDTYFTVLMGSNTFSNAGGSGNNICGAQTIWKPSYGGNAGRFFGGWPTIGYNGAPTGNSGVNHGLIPAHPIFPMVGYVGNPLLGAVAFWQADVSDGQIFQVTMYGTTYPFLCSTKSATQAMVGNTTSAIGILWQ